MIKAELVELLVDKRAFGMKYKEGDVVLCLKLFDFYYRYALLYCPETDRNLSTMFLAEAHGNQYRVSSDNVFRNYPENVWPFLTNMPLPKDLLEEQKMVDLLRKQGYKVEKK